MFVVATASALHVTMPTIGYHQIVPQLHTQKSLLVQPMTTTTVVERQNSQESHAASSLLRDWMRSASNGGTLNPSVQSVSWSSVGKLCFIERSVLAGTLL